MIKHTEVNREITEKQQTSIVCDICRTEYSFEKDFVETQEFQTISFIGGYGSEFGDGARVSCDICQHCLFKLIGQYCRYENILF